MKLISLAAIVLFASSAAFCDSVPFSVTVDQRNGSVILDPNGNPVLGQSFCSPMCRLQINVEAPSPSTPTDYTFSYSFAFGSQLFSGGPLTLTCSPEGNPCSIGYSFPADCCNKTAIAATFTATVNGVAQTFHFQYQPLATPEPATMSLLGTGLVAIGYRKYRAKRQASSLLRN